MVRAKDELAGKTVLLNLSGRGDKDVAQVQAILDGDPVALETMRS
jgi:tryptophan synthase beta subunit